MAQEWSATEVAAKVNELILDPVTKTRDLMSSSAHLSSRLCQDALEVGVFSITTARQFRETVQRRHLDLGDILIEFGKVSLQGQMKLVESVQASLARGRWT